MRRKVKSQADVDRYIKQGLGQGEREEYQPWLRVQDVPSRGRSCKVHGFVVSRNYQLLSDLEYAYWLQLDFSETVLDIREQFPLLPVSALQAIASSRGVEYPAYVGTKVPVPYVMTTDFVITVLASDGSKKTVARTVKYLDELIDEKTGLRTAQKLEIEEEYWTAQGVSWNVVTEKNMPVVVTRNLDWLRKDSPFQNKLESDEAVCVFIQELKRAQFFGWTLRRTLEHVSTRMRERYEICAYMYRFVVWNKLIRIDLMKPITLNGPFPEFEILDNSLTDTFIAEVV